MRAVCAAFAAMGFVAIGLATISLAAHPAATVVEVGTGLNTRFERVDNGQVHWLDVDLPDTIALRRKFFADTARRRMVAASVLDEDWFPAVAQQPGPYFFVAEGVLVYLPEDQVTGALARIAARFGGALLALDTANVNDRKALSDTIMAHRRLYPRSGYPRGRHEPFPAAGR